MNDISAELPAPRDDEPESLRADVIDELTDHLQCAFHRELHTRNTDPDPESAARKRVLSRFGNPAAIARKLWYDAMQERIMNQRLTIAVLVVLVLMSAGMFVISWQSLGANREMVRESHELNRELIAELRNLAAANAARPTPPAQPAEWNRLIVRCVLDTEDGPPAEGVRVLLDAESENTKGIPQAVEFTGADGEIDFGLVLYGVYELRVTATTGETHERSVSIRPGMDRTETIVCPSQLPAETTASFEVSLPDSVPVPDELRDRLWLLCTLENGGRDISGNHWVPSQTGLDVSRRQFLIRVADGEAGELDPGWWARTGGVELQEPVELPRSFRPLYVPENQTTTKSVPCHAGEYRVLHAYALVELLDETPQAEVRVFAHPGNNLNLVGRNKPGWSDPWLTAVAEKPNQWVIQVESRGLTDQFADLASLD